MPVVFSSVVFVFGFLPVALGLYHSAPRRHRNLVLSLLSLAFYVWGAGSFVLWLLISAAVDFRIARAIAAADSPSRRRSLVAVSICGNVTLLAYFKYLGLAADLFNWLAGSVGVGEISVGTVALPLAISFFTFQRMSFTFDVANGSIRELPTFVDYLTFSVLFPHLVAGPIVRYLDIADELGDRADGSEQVAAGAVRFAHGLGKKVLIADYLAPVANTAFTNLDGPASTAGAWIGILAYTFQLYFDFSGYSDMAIGLGQMFGFTFPENFRRPYAAVSVTDFWRRWHVSLSNWFRDYLFIPLGGSRVGRATTIRNIAIVFAVTGLWHGAALTFVAWGCYHGFFVILERRTGYNRVDRAPRSEPLRRGVTFVIVVIGWVLFRASSMSHAGNYYRAMFSVRSGNDHLPLDHRTLLAGVLAVLVVVLPGDRGTGRRLVEDGGRLASVGRLMILAVVLPVSLTLVAVGSFSPFLYFRF